MQGQAAPGPEPGPVHILRAAPKRKRLSLPEAPDEASARPAVELADNGSPRPAVKRKRTALTKDRPNRNQFVNSYGELPSCHSITLVFKVNCEKLDCFTSEGLCQAGPNVPYFIEEWKSRKQQSVDRLL